MNSHKELVNNHHKNKRLQLITWAIYRLFHIKKERDNWERLRKLKGIKDSIYEFAKTLT